MSAGVFRRAFARVQVTLEEPVRRQKVVLLDSVLWMRGNDKKQLLASKV